MKNRTMKIKCMKAEGKFRDFNCWIYLSVTYIPIRAQRDIREGLAIKVLRLKDTIGFHFKKDQLNV